MEKENNFQRKLIDRKEFKVYEWMQTTATSTANAIKQTFGIKWKNPKHKMNNMFEWSIYNSDSCILAVQCNF